MFAQFLNIIVRSIKLDKSLYRDNKYFGEAGVYFAGLVMILDGVAGAVAANTIIKTSVGISGLTAIITWFVWAIFIYVIGVKLFSDKDAKIPFKKSTYSSWVRTCPWLIKIFCCNPRICYTNYIFNSIMDICLVNNFNKTST